jgi:hypothetical protein
MARLATIFCMLKDMTNAHYEATSLAGIVTLWLYVANWHAAAQNHPI